MAFDLDEHYDAYPRVEEQFQSNLDESLNPRGPELLYELVEGLGLPQMASVLDVGCGEGDHSLRLARLGFDVMGIDPIPRHLELAREAADGSASFALGTAEKLPVNDSTMDLVWCRDVLVHVEDLDAAFGEFHRVLRGGGKALVYQLFATELLEPGEARRVFDALGVVNADPQRMERAIAASGMVIDERLDLGAEWGEYAEERTGKSGRNLLHAARLQRDPDRYIERFGRAAYDIKLADCLWHVYRMLGKLSSWVYVLSA